MALSNYNFGSLACQYDRIMNASQGNLQPKSRQADVFASIVKTIGQIVASFQVRFRFDSQLHSNTEAVESSGRHSVASHIMPGEISWHETLDANINVDSTSSTHKFSSFLMNIGKVRDETTILDNRAEFDSVSVST